MSSWRYAPREHSVPKPAEACQSSTRFDFGDEALAHGEDLPDDDAHALRVRMQSVGQGQGRVARNPVEEERVENQTVFAGKLRINGIECLDIFGPEVLRRLHAAQKHRDGARLQ